MEKVNIGTKVDKKLHDEGMHIIQNKMNTSFRAWLELKLKELIKEDNKMEGGKEK